MRFSTFTFFASIGLFAGWTQAQQVIPAEKKSTEKSAADTQNETVLPKEDTVYVVINDGVPRNRERFEPERLLRRGPTFDEALKVGYTYTLSFSSGSFGTFAQQSYMAHIAYEFTPNLHLYADLGLWMPLYVNFRNDIPIAKEDVRQGRVGFVLPDIALEYRPSETTYFRLQFVNERDALRAYGPLNYHSLYCNPYRNSIFCR